MDRLLRRRSRTPGQGLVEFALIVPLAFALILGIVEVGRLVFNYHTLNNATREGVRYAIVHGENAFDGCPSGPTPPDSSPCDTSGNNIRAAVIDAATALNPAGLTFGWSGDGSFPMYWSALDDCRTDSFPGCSTDPYNRVGNNVTLRVDYLYAPLVFGDLLGSINIKAETTLVINN